MFKSFTQGYSVYCSKECSYRCPLKIAKEKATSLKNNSKQITVTKRKETWMKKYGVINVLKLPENRKKAAETLSQTIEWKRKREKTNIKKFSNKTYCGSKDYYLKKQEILNKSKKTCLDKYGVEFHSQSEVVKNKMKETRIKNKNQIPDEQLNDFEIYHKKVWSITRTQDISTLKNIERRGHPRYGKNAYHLDHIISIKEGFLRGYSVQYIGSIDNLQMLSCRDNSSKQSNSWSLITNKKENKWEPLRK